ncbi:MAG: DUF2807 domain-containing protein [Bacteroidales bacterium]|nr:DUF2807 domain-containing protein [Bacteroidales bacterium]
MKRIIVILATAATLASCFVNVNFVRGNGVAASKAYDVAPFTEIVLSGSEDIVYRQGGQVSVILYTDENLIEYYEIESLDGCLYVKYQAGVSLSPKTESRVEVVAPDMNALRVQGSGDIKVLGPVKSEGEMALSVSGSGDISADAIDAASFRAKVSGSGDIEVDALTCGGASLSVNGSGDIDITCRGAGDIEARVNGSGDITLRGTARSLNSKVSGSGDVNSGGLQLVP